MENVSHAIIMAGGILITLLILTIAAILYMSFSNTTQEIVTTWDTAELAKYNSPFVSFLGREEVTAQEIVTLITLSKQRGGEVNIFIGGTNAKDWDTDKINKFLNENILTTVKDGSGNEVKQNTFSYDSLKYDNYGRISEIKFKKN